MKKIKLITLLAVISILTTSLTVPAVPADSQVQETMLPNGMKIITKEVHTAPVVSFMIWYKVGSRNEDLGKTGLSHLLEHMMFKGTKKYKKGEIDKLVQENGGISNAGTSKDFTNYYEILSSDKIELAMQIESDRMKNSLIDPKEFEAEKVVVLSELEGHENEPDSLIYYDIYAAAFKAHPYHWPTIGWKDDVKNLTRDDLYKYYKTYYVPNNATAVIVGDFDTEQVIKLMKKYFGRIPRGPEPPPVTAIEPVQSGERAITINKAGSTARIMIGYHTPAGDDPDIYALDILEMILSSGRSSRLYKALVDKQLATEVQAGSSTSKDPNLFYVAATAGRGVNIEDVKAAIMNEIDRIKTEPVPEQEFQKAINQLESQFIYMNDSVSSQAIYLGYYESIISWRYLESYLENIKKVTPDDLQKVAQKYFNNENMTAATFIPDTTADSIQSSSMNTLPTTKLGMVAAYKPEESKEQATSSPASESSKGLSRTMLDNGIVVIIQENRSNPTIAVKGSINAGSMLDPEGKIGLADITASLLRRGTTNRSADQISEEMDYAAMSLGTSASTESAGFSGEALSKDFDLMLDLLSDMLRNPIFPEEEMEKLKTMRISGLSQETEAPGEIASREFWGSVFPKGHPYHQPTIEEEISSISSLARDDIVNFYKAHYGPESIIIVIVGDVDTNEALEKIEAHFGNWERTGASAKEPIPDTPIQTGIVRKIIPMEDKSQVEIMLGYSSGLKRSDPDYYAAAVMNYVLGGGGALGSRLGEKIRDEMGFVYNIYSTFDAGNGEGPWYVYLGTNPDNADKAVDEVISQMKFMSEKGVTQEELNRAINYIAGSFPVRNEKNSSIARTLHYAEFYGLGINYFRDYQSIYRAVTLDQANQAAKKYLYPDSYTLIIAGPYSESDQP